MSVPRGILEVRDRRRRRSERRRPSMVDARIEVVFVPVSDADRAKEFYVEKLGWHLDHDQTGTPELRFVQVTPNGSACSIAFGPGISSMEPGTLHATMAVVADADAAREELLQAGGGRRRGRRRRPGGVAPGGRRRQPGRRAGVGPFRVLRRPGRQPLEPAAAAEARL